MRSILLKILALVSFLGVVVVNFLANFLPINNVATGAVSDSYPNLFAPIGLTFSIWGVIYLALFFFILYSFNVFGEVKRKDLVDKINIYFIISSVANIVWIFLWHYDLIGLSIIAMITILVCLILIVNLIVFEKKPLSYGEYFLLRFPFSIYFGWITVATIANITTFLVSINWQGFGVSDVIWTIIILLVGAIIGVIVSIRNSDSAYVLVLLWAYFGILLKHISIDGFNLEYSSIISAVIFCMAVFVLVLGYLLKKYFLPERVR
ncbi:MAG: tryptophan-rich sensory protein [Candidatus Woesearchaeota archaeon]